jgi:tripartite-type tricarboxylate transporter receptor subunit TctC
MATHDNNRRQLLLAGLGTLGSTLAPAAWAQTRPKGKPVKILVGFPPGQATDAVARMLAEKLQRNSGETFIVENLPGQGGSLALGNLAKAPNDGSVMMLAHMSALCTNPHLYKSVPSDTMKDFEAVGLLGDLPFVLVSNPALPFQNVQDLVTYAKANPDKLNNASSGNGTVSHLAMEELKRKTGIKIAHIPYKGSAAGLTDVMSGNVSVALETAAAVRPLVQAGKLRALAAGSATRLPGTLAGVPTLAEQGFAGFNAVTWLMVLYPAGASKALVQSTFAEFNAAARDPEVEQKLITAGLLPRFSTSPEDATTYLRSEYKSWGEVVKRSGVTLE